LYRGDPNNPLSLNYYTYCYNNPILYTDPDGRAPIIIPIIIGALKVIDYGWTAWDIYNSTKTFMNPKASTIDRAIAGIDLILTGTMELAEPDDYSPVSLPIDDLLRKGTTKELKKLAKREGLPGLMKGIKEAFGDNAPKVVKQLYDAGLFREIMSVKDWNKALKGLKGKELQVHHVIPVAWAKDFFRDVIVDFDEVPGAVLDFVTHSGKGTGITAPLEALRKQVTEELAEKGIEKGTKEAREYALDALSKFYTDRKMEDMANAVIDFFKKQQ